MKIAAFSKALCLALITTPICTQDSNAQEKQTGPTPSKGTKNSATFRDIDTIKEALDLIISNQKPKENFVIVATPDAVKGLNSAFDNSMMLGDLTTIQRVEKVIQSIGLQVALIKGWLFVISNSPIDIEAWTAANSFT